MARTLRESLKHYGSGRKLSAEDATVVAENLLASTAYTDHQKQYAADSATKYCVKYVTWGGRRQKALHMLYGGSESPKSLALTLGKLEARPAKRVVAKRSTPNRNKVLAACRAVIAPQIAQYREAFWATYDKRVQAALDLRMDPPPFPRCALSGRNLKSCRTHVDHVAPPFVQLVANWLAEEGLTADEVGASTAYRRSLKRASMGDVLDKSWHDYHAKHATLALVEAKANMRKGSKIVALDEPANVQS